MGFSPARHEPVKPSVTDRDGAQSSATSTPDPAKLAPVRGSRPQPTIEIQIRTDIYSLGALAFFLLTGEPPFVRGTAAQLRLAHISEPAMFPEQATIAVPPDLQSVVLRCLAKDPARRFQSADRLSQALADCTTNP